MRTAYKVRAYPDTEQVTLLRRTFGCVRLVWNKTLTARQERYTLEQRGTHDRDINAAKNIDTAAGLAVAASGGPVRPERATARHSPVNEEPQPVKVGIPDFSRGEEVNRVDAWIEPGASVDRHLSAVFLVRRRQSASTAARRRDRVHVHR